MNEIERIKNLRKKGLISRREAKELMDSVTPPKIKPKRKPQPLFWSWALISAAALLTLYWVVFNHEFSSSLQDTIREIGLFPWGDAT